MLDHIKGIAAGSGLSFNTVFKAYHHPSLVLNLIPRIIKKLDKAFQKLSISLNACSSFAAKNEFTKNRELIIGRNLD